MLQKLIPLFLVIITQGVLLAVVSTALATAASSTNSSFIFNGFQDANIRLNGAAKIEPGGILRLTNTTTNDVGHAFYPKPFPFLNSSSGEALSFSTSFVFAIVPQFQNLSSHGLAFTISPSPDISAGFPDQYFGLFNMTHNGNPKNRIVAVELDTIQNKEFYDINNNHVGIDVNSVISLSSAPASYAVRSSTGPLFHNLSLISGKPMRIWVEYDGKNMQFNVTIAPLDVVKPYVPLLSSIVNLSSVFLDQMFVGFCSSTGAIYGMHYILGWSFSSNGNAEDLDLSNIPPIPGRVVQENSRKPNKSLSIVLPIGITLLVLSTVAGVLIVLVRRRKKFSVMIEDRDTVYGPRRFLYRTLYRATGGFSNKNLLGSGGFGKVYKGQLQKSKKEIAVKRISEYSRQGMKEFISEISTIGRLRHRNLVQLLGYSQGRELLLVYDYMPKGSLDKYIFGRPQEPLNWPQRFKIIKDIASGLLYLHEEWEQTVIHRDIKASNVLLDAEFNAKLGDFGLARQLDRESNAHTTRVIGTLGYLAPELSISGKATTNTDVFAFGAFMLEVTCGKRPVQFRTSGVQMVLVDWVLEYWMKGELIEARDKRMGGDFAAVEVEVELVLRLGCLCSLPEAASRPSMRQVVQYLERNLPLPEISVCNLSAFNSSTPNHRLVVDVSSTISDGAPISDPPS